MNATVTATAPTTEKKAVEPTAGELTLARLLVEARLPKIPSTDPNALPNINPTDPALPGILQTLESEALEHEPGIAAAITQAVADMRGRIDAAQVQTTATAAAATTSDGNVAVAAAQAATPTTPPDANAPGAQSPAVAAAAAIAATAPSASANEPGAAKPEEVALAVATATAPAALAEKFKKPEGYMAKTAAEVSCTASCPTH